MTQRTGVRSGALGQSAASLSSPNVVRLQSRHHSIILHGPVNQGSRFPKVPDRFVRSRRTGLLNKAGRPAEKGRGRPERRVGGLTGAQTENLQGRIPRGATERKPMAMLRKTQRVASGARRAMLLTTGDLNSVVGRFGSSGRIRTYNPSLNSRNGCSRLALQTQGLHARNSDYRVNWGDSGGTAHGFIETSTRPPGRWRRPMFSRFTGSSSL